MMMPSRSVAQVAAVIAVLTGATRIGLAFEQPDGATVREALYLAVDAGILLTVVAFYGLRHRGVGVAAALGFLAASAGNLVIMGPEPGFLGENNYALGAAAMAIGWAILSVAMTRLGRGSVWMSAAFCASVVCGTLAGALGASWFASAGAMFGVGLFLTGIVLLRGASDLRHETSRTSLLGSLNNLWLVRSRPSPVAPSHAHQRAPSAPAATP